MSTVPGLPAAETRRIGQEKKDSFLAIVKKMGVLWMYLIGSTTEPGIPDRATMPQKTLDAKHGVLIFFLLIFALILRLAKVGDYCFFCLLLRQHYLLVFLFSL